MKRILLLLSILLSYLMSWAQTDKEIETIDRIKSQIEKYYWGEAEGYNEASVISEAQIQMSVSIQSYIVFKGVNVYEDDKEYYSSDAMVKSAVKLNNVKKIVYNTTSKNGEHIVHAFIYITREEFDKNMEQERARMNQRVQSLIKEGCLQERKVNIADALRYFNWAINISKFYNIYLALPETDGRPVDLWLDDKIKSILANIDVTLDNDNIKVDDNEYDKYTINLKFTYAGRPVSLLEFRYFTGETNVMVTAKNGEAVIKYPSLDGIKEISMNILYAYDGENDLDEELLEVYRSSPRKSYDNVNVKHLPVKIKREQIKSSKPALTKEETETLTQIKENEVGSVAPNVKDLLKETERQYITQGPEYHLYVNVAAAVIASIRSGNYDDVKPMFNDDAFAQFQRMTRMGHMAISKDPTIILERALPYVRCSKIPVSVKTGNKIRNENIVLRFNPDDNKISSIGYALTENAENDIFSRNSQWSLDARYALLKFMEDYQTAFAVKDIDYIEQIFDDNAVIITGNVIQRTQNKISWESPTSISMSVVNGIRYKSFDKRSYITNLKNVFDRNNYVYLTFHDAVINKASTPTGMNEVYWIELQQDHNSTKYNDKGYLTLQIGIQPKGSIIYVRTWTPTFVSLDEMKKRYPCNTTE